MRKWFVVDASGLALGRLASRVARILMGKENPKYTPFIDTGDHVVIINADKDQGYRHEVLTARRCITAIMGILAGCARKR